MFHLVLRAHRKSPLPLQVHRNFGGPRKYQSRHHRQNNARQKFREHPSARCAASRNRLKFHLIKIRYKFNYLNINLISNATYEMSISYYKTGFSIK